jgi:tetratricopeptide (TPR) repeat protein
LSAAEAIAIMGFVAHDVFISYASENKAVADAVCATLESRQIRCWIAPRDILPGRNYPESIEQAIEASRIVVVVFSQHAADSRDVRSEIHLAFQQELMIIPFRIEEIHPAKGMNYWLGAVHWLDAMSPPLEKHLATLADRVRGQLGPSPQQPPQKPDRSEKPEARACHERGVARYHKEEFSEAVAEFTRAIELDPSIAWAFNDRGLAHLQRGDLESALADLTRGLSLDPAPAWAWHGRGCVHSRMNRKEAAVKDFTEAIRRDPSVAWFFHDRGVAHLELQAYSAAVEDFTQAMLRNPEMEWAYRNRARAHEKLGNHELAMADLARTGKPDRT